MLAQSTSASIVQDSQLSANRWLSASALAQVPGRILARVQRVALLARLALVDLGPTVRRLVDVVGTGLGLLLAAPVLMLAALAIKLESRGPIFFRQERIGRDGRAFGLFKLRTMVHGADALKTALTAQHAGASDGIRFKMKRDPRVTRVGAFLRRFSLDEVPQLWNVFCGDMTLVGPRPAVRREVVLYSPTDARRLEVTPGLTCLWQVGGRSELSFQQQVSLDLQFIDTVGPLGEIAIVLRTVPAVLSGRGAY